jgi:hypothetical protein
MKAEENEFIPHPPEDGETYGSYCHRLEEALIKITDLQKPPEMAIRALAFIAVEVPSDFDHCSIREVPPYRRMREFLSKLPTESRNLFRAEAMKLSPREEGRIDRLLKNF